MFGLHAEVVGLVDDLLSQLGVVFYHHLTSLKDHLVQIFLDLVFGLECLPVSLEEDQERYDVVLRGHVSHGVESTHEPEGSLHLTLGEFPVLLEQEKREHSRDAFTTKTESELAFVGVVEATSSILVLLEVEDGRFHEAVKTHESRHDTLDSQLGRVHDSSF